MKNALFAAIIASFVTSVSFAAEATAPAAEGNQPAAAEHAKTTETTANEAHGKMMKHHKMMKKHAEEKKTEEKKAE